MAISAFNPDKRLAKRAAPKLLGVMPAKTKLVKVKKLQPLRKAINGRI